MVVSKVNCGKDYMKNLDVAKNLKNIEMYTLTDGVHPNTYDENSNKINICEAEFKRLIEDTRFLLKNEATK